MQPGDSVEIAGTTVTLAARRAGRRAQLHGHARAASSHRDGGRAVLTPQRRIYSVQGTVTTEAAIHTSGLADLYAVLGEGSGGGGLGGAALPQPAGALDLGRAR